MRRISSFTILLSVSLVVSPGFGPFLAAQTALPGPQGTSCWPQSRSNPDSLLAQITTAATNPQEILDVDNWLQDNQGQTRTALIDAAQQQGFDPAFIGLVNFPQVLEMMAQHVDDYAAIGLSAAAPVVSSAADRVAQPSGLSRRLALSAGKSFPWQPAAISTIPTWYGGPAFDSTNSVGVHKRSQGSVTSQGRNPHCTRVNGSKDTSRSADSLMVSKQTSPPS